MVTAWHVFIDHWMLIFWILFLGIVLLGLGISAVNQMRFRIERRRYRRSSK